MSQKRKTDRKSKKSQHSKKLRPHKHAHQCHNRMKAELSGIVRSLADAGACVVISTHDVEFAALTTDRCVILAEGDIVADGPTRTVCCASPAFSPQVAKVFHPHDVLTVAEVREALAVQGLVS